MTGLGIQAWALVLIGLRVGFRHNDVMELLEVLRVFAHSYRLASMGCGSAISFNRSMLCFCRTLVEAAMCKTAWQRPALQRFRGVKFETCRQTLLDAASADARITKLFPADAFNRGSCV